MCVANASVNSDFLYSTTYNISVYGGMGYNASESTYPIEFEMGSDGVKYAYYYRLHDTQFLFSSSPDYYGYQIFIQNMSGNSFNANSMIQWVAPVIGTYSDIYTGNSVMAQQDLFDTSSRQYDYIWIETNNNQTDYFISSLFRLRSFESSSGTVTDPFVDFSGNLSISVYGYTKEQYDSYMSSSLEEQTRIQEQMRIELESQSVIQDDIRTELQGQTQIQEDMKNELEEQTEAQKGFFSTFFQNLLDFFIGLIVPSVEDVQKWLESFQSFCREHFGVLFAPFDIFLSIVDALLLQSDDNLNFVFPSFTIMGFTVWEEFHISFNDNTLALFIFDQTRIITGVLLVGLFLKYLKMRFHSVFRG